MAGSTSTPSRGGSFPRRPVRLRSATASSATAATASFDDVTGSSGLAKLAGGYGHGVAVGDYDNDGRPDLFVTRWRSYALYHNLGQGRFEDATATAGLGGDRDWPTSAAWADLDNDGDLDLYVCHYLKWDECNPTLCDVPGQTRGRLRLLRPARLPRAARPCLSQRRRPVCRRDRGDRHSSTSDGRGLGVVAADLDDDGKIDLFVANDTTANYFLHNQGGFRFSEEGLESGLAASAGGGYLAGMGVACGDFDGDGRLDLAVTNFFNQSTTLYHNHGGGIFSDRSTETGLAAATRLVLGFGLAALDANNDGWLDLVQANGHVSDLRPHAPVRDACPALSRATARENSSTYRIERALPGRSPGWDADWPSATSTTTDASTSSSSRRMPRWPCSTISRSSPKPLPHVLARGNQPRIATPSARGWP